MANLSQMRLSLVIPAWNEHDTIRQAVREATESLIKLVSDYEIIVVDDGSTDGTADIVSAEAELNPNVCLVQHPENRGYGAALRTGFRAARMDLVAFTDADCQFDLNELEYMLPLTRHYQITAGYRIDRKDPLFRRFLSWGYNTLTNILMGSPVHDIDCALKIFHRKPLQSLLPESDNFFANTEMLTRAKAEGISIVEVGVHHRPRAAGQSKVSPLDIPRTLSSLLPFCWSRVFFPGKEMAESKGALYFWLGLLVVALVACAFLFPNLHYPLLEPDEGRYAEIGRVMLTSGDWVVPVINGKPYYDKPPLFYWLVASSFALFGPSETSARLMPTMAAFLTVLAVYFFGHRLVGQHAAFLGAMALSLMVGFVQCGRFLIIDSVLTLFVTLALFSAFEAVRGGVFRPSWWLASAFFCSLGVLTKGPVVGVLILPPLLAHVWLCRSKARPIRKHWALFLAIVAIVVSPWYIAMIARQPDFAYEFFINHHLRRFFSDWYHAKPIWFYVPVALVSSLPWSFLLVPFLQFLVSRSPSIRTLRTPVMGFLLLWATWCFAFFSLSKGKLPPYIMPMAAPVALLIGGYLKAVLFQSSPRPFFEVSRRLVPQHATTVLAGIWLMAGILGWSLNLVSASEALPQILVAGILTASAALWARRLPAKTAWTACALLGAVTVIQAAHELVPAWSYQHSLVTCSPEVAALVHDERLPIACYGREWGSVSFYLSRDNVRNFDKRSPEELKNFLESHSKTLLLVDGNQDLNNYGWAIPDGKMISRVLSAGKGKLAIITSVDSLD